jgi:peptidoglycan/LPS O-acetylase OafA/YrhL
LGYRDGALMISEPQSAPSSAPRHGAQGLPYLPALDGLRAFAVAVVLLYHAGVARFPGGFLGVDVFFALSGYLITSLLLAEHGATGRLDLRRFWIRRARRLLPAAVLVIVVCVVIAAVFLPGDLAQTRADALASLAYVNNWHQVLADQSYFAHFGRPPLLGHLWSLAVEEQFYLFWPIMLGLGLLTLGRRKVVIGTLALALASVLLMAVLYGPGDDPSRVYYGTDTRAAALLGGALLAFWWVPGRLPRVPRALLNAVAVLAFGGVLAAVLGWHDFDPWLYPWGLTVVEIATVALIAAIAHPDCLVGRGFGADALRWVGKRSYGIYLWHWPVMALTRPGTDVALPRGILIPLQMAVVVGIAALSYRYVEIPIRTGTAQRWVREWMERRLPRQRLAVVLGALAAVLLVVGWAARPMSEPASAALSQRASAAAVTTPVRAAAAADHRSRVPLCVGASVMLAARPAIEHRPCGRVDAAVARSTDDLIGRLETYRGAGALPARVIVQVGENGPLWSADVERLRRALEGVDVVVLVNVRVPRSWESQVNDQLAAAAATWPQAVIADWHRASARADLLYDGAHPDPAGQRAYARVISRALRAR